MAVKLTVLSWYCQKLELPAHTRLFINLLRPSLCHFHIQEWDVISLEAKNLISHLLVRDATKRYTTEMILQHPWIQEVTIRSLLPSFLLCTGFLPSLKASLNFVRLSFRTYISCVFNCHDPHLFLDPFVQIYEIHIFIIYFSLLYFHRRATHLFPPLPY